MKKKAVVLLSGGIDSSTALAIAKEKGYEIYALTFNYGQRNSIEMESAKKVASAIGVKEQKIFNLDLREVAKSALTGNPDVPKEKNTVDAKIALQDIGKGLYQNNVDYLPEAICPDGEQKKVPATYVPARNTIFLSIALAWAESLGAEDIFIGVNAVDYSGYPDCRSEYIEAFGRLAKLAIASGRVTIHAPLLRMGKAEIIRKGTSLGVDYSKTWSCYDSCADGKACGKCDSCRLRLEGFKKAGITDPIQYRIRD